MTRYTLTAADLLIIMTTLSESKLPSKSSSLRIFIEKVFIRQSRPYVHPYVGGALLGLVLFLDRLIPH